MKPDHISPVLLWAAIAVGILLTFDFFPALGRFPAILIVTPALVAAFLRFSAARQKRTFSWQKEVVFGIKAKHFVLVGVAIVLIAFGWLVMALKFVRGFPDDFVIMVIIPTCCLILLASVAIGVSLYCALDR